MVLLIRRESDVSHFKAMGILFTDTDTHTSLSFNMQNKTNDARCNGSCADATQVRATRLHKVRVQGRMNEIRIAEMSDGQFLICCTDYYRAIGALGSSKSADVKNSVMLFIVDAKMTRPMVFAPLSSVRRLSCSHINRV